MSSLRHYCVLVEQTGVFRIVVSGQDEESAEQRALDLLCSEPERFEQVHGNAHILAIEEVRP